MLIAGNVDATTGLFTDMKWAAALPAGWVEVTSADAQMMDNAGGFKCYKPDGKGGVIADAAAIAAWQLDDAKATQSKQISDACRSAIIAGVQSSALGSPHLYPCNNTPASPDQSNMEGSVTESNTDRQNAAPWTANDATVVVGDPVAGYRTVGSAVLEAVAVAANGTTGATSPAVPAVGAQVVDGGVTWKLWSTPFMVQDIATGVWAFVDHTELQIQRAGKDMKAHILTNRVRCKTLIDQINAAATIAAVQAIVW